jgi:threonine/homoserine/homoserine lactone efflux protein
VRERLALDLAVKTAVLAALITGVNIAWLYAGVSLTRCFRQPRANRAINIAFALLLVASVAFALRF